MQTIFKTKCEVTIQKVFSRENLRNILLKTKGKKIFLSTRQICEHIYVKHIYMSTYYSDHGKSVDKYM